MKCPHLSYPRKITNANKGVVAVTPIKKVTNNKDNKTITIIIINMSTKSKWQLKNFAPRNIYYAVQGHYRKWIAQQYSKFDNGLATRILEFEDCLGTHPDCGCPMAEILLSDKPYKKCK